MAETVGAERAGAPRAMIVHGYWSAPDRNWFPWLAGRLEADGYEVARPAMPDSKHPDKTAWHTAMRAALPSGDMDGRTLLVGHSLGCYGVLSYLQGCELAEPVAGVVLAAGFDRALSSEAPDLDLINAFVAAPLDFDRLRASARAFTVISSVDDPIVPHEYSRALAERLGATFTPRRSGGHLMGSEGVTELPEAYEALRRMMPGR